jgi:hypothetical protein
LTWNTELPPEKYFDEFRQKLTRYQFKKELVEDILPRCSRSPLPNVVRDIILDQWSFLKEKSIIMLAADYFAKYIFQWGIPLLNCTNQVYDIKRTMLEPYRGLKFMLGVAVATGGYLATRDPKLQSKVAIAGLALAILDP